MDSSTALLALAGTNVLLAVSLAFPLSCGIVSLASAAFMGIGAYATLLLVGDAGWLWPLAVPAAGSITLLVALPVGLLVARLPPSLATVTTLIFALGAAGVLAGRPPPGTIDRSLIPQSAVGSLLMAALLLATYALLQTRRARFGQALLTIRTDQTFAESLGIDVSSHKCLAFLLSAATAGAAGSLGALLAAGAGGTTVDLQVSVASLEATVIGGIAASWGPWLGALVLSFLPLVAQLALGSAGMPDAGGPAAAASFQPIAGGVVTLLILLVAPGGISGSVRRWRQRQRSVSSNRRVTLAPDTTMAPPTPIVALPRAPDELAPLDSDSGPAPAIDDGGIDSLPSEPPYHAAAS